MSFNYKKYKQEHKENFTHVILKEDFSKGSKVCEGEYSVCDGKKRPLYCFEKSSKTKDGYKKLCIGCDNIRWMERQCKLYKGKWKGKYFQHIPWQKVVTYDVFGTIKPDGKRQYKEVFIEVPKKQGKSPIVSVWGSKLFFADHEPGAEIYCSACDIKQASIIFNNIKHIIEQNDKLGKRCKIIDSTKRIVHNTNMGAFISVVSADTKTKHGIDLHACLFDEIHAQPNRDLYDVMTKGSGDAREQPLFFYITTAGWDRNSICWELHQRALKAIQNPEYDPTFYGVIFNADEEDDWTSEETWKKANPSLGYTIDIETIREACNIAKQQPAEENYFRRMRLNQWVKQESRYIPMKEWDKNDTVFEIEDLKKELFFGAFDLSSKIDLTCYLILCRYEGLYCAIPYFWIPEDNIKKRVRKDKVPYDIWVKQGLIEATPGNVIDHEYVEKQILQINSEFEVQEIGFDPHMAVRMSQNLIKEELKLVPINQKSGMCAATNELLTIVLNYELCTNNHPVLRWMADNLVVIMDAEGKVRPAKDKSTERIDGMVALIMALDRCIRHEYEEPGSVYDDDEPIIV